MLSDIHVLVMTIMIVNHGLVKCKSDEVRLSLAFLASAREAVAEVSKYPNVVVLRHCCQLFRVYSKRAADLASPRRPRILLARSLAHRHKPTVPLASIARHNTAATIGISIPCDKSQVTQEP
jgi:hypothetical protein